MPPGTIHTVISLTDCLTEGGHFYSAHSLVKSLDAGVREHLRGASDTNTQHISAELILHSLLEGYMTDLAMLRPDADSLRKSRLLSSSVRPLTTHQQ